MSDSYDDYEAKIQLAEHAWEKRVVKTEHNKQLEIAQAYERGWNAALAQREWVGLTANEIWECNKAKSGAVEFHICYEHQNLEDFAEAIEAKLKEKNQ